MPHAGTMASHRDEMSPLPVFTLPSEDQRKTGYLQFHSEIGGLQARTVDSSPREHRPPAQRQSGQPGARESTGVRGVHRPKSLVQESQRLYSAHARAHKVQLELRQQDAREPGLRDASATEPAG